MDKYWKSELIEILILIIYVVVVVGIMSLFFGLGAGGFDKNEILSKNNFYIPYAAIFLIGLIACKFLGLFIFGKKNEKIDGAVINDPEKSVVGQFKLFKNPLLLIFFSFILFAILGYIASINNTFFTALPDYEQQFTPAADLFFSTYPASPTETLGALFLISVYGLFLGFLVLKNKIKPWMFLVLYIPGGAIVSMIYGIIDHIARYSSSDIAMQYVMIFWFVGGLITTITGSIIPFLIMHDMNNFFGRFSKLFSSDIVSFVTFSILALAIFTFIFIYLKTKDKKELNNK